MGSGHRGTHAWKSAFCRFAHRVFAFEKYAKRVRGKSATAAAAGVLGLIQRPLCAADVWACLGFVRVECVCERLLYQRRPVQVRLMEVLCKAAVVLLDCAEAEVLCLFFLIEHCVAGPTGLICTYSRV